MTVHGLRGKNKARSSLLGNGIPELCYMHFSQLQFDTCVII